MSIALVGATLAPLARDPDHDSFPLSTYPMFAMRRPTTLTLDYAYGLTATGARRTLSPAAVGTKEVLQAAAIFERAVHDGPKALVPLCAQIAAHVADPDVVSVRIVTGTHDAVDYLVRGVIGVEHDRWGCRVPR